MHRCRPATARKSKSEKAEDTTVRSKICEVEGRAGGDRKTQTAHVPQGTVQNQGTRRRCPQHKRLQEICSHKGYPSREWRFILETTYLPQKSVSKAKYWMFKPRTVLRCQCKSPLQSLVHFRGYNWWKMLCQCFRSHFGSSHFLFERERCFSRSRTFLVLSCPSVYNPVFVISHPFSWHV